MPIGRFPLAPMAGRPPGFGLNWVPDRFANSFWGLPDVDCVRVEVAGAIWIAIPAEAVQSGKSGTCWTIPPNVALVVLDLRNASF